MGTNSEIYLIGLAILFFLIIVFLFVKKITNSDKLQVKIEAVPDSFDSIEKYKQSKYRICPRTLGHKRITPKIHLT